MKRDISWFSMMTLDIRYALLAGLSRGLEVYLDSGRYFPRVGTLDPPQPTVFTTAVHSMFGSNVVATT